VLPASVLPSKVESDPFRIDLQLLNQGLNQDPGGRGKKNGDPQV